MTAEDVNDERQEENQFGRSVEETHVQGAEIGRTANDVDFFAAAQFNQFGERLLPSVHLDDAHARYDFVHRPNAFIGALGRLHSQPGKYATHPT